MPGVNPPPTPKIRSRIEPGAVAGVAEPEYRLPGLAVLANRENAGDIDEAAGGLAVGALLLSSHAGMVWPRRPGRQAPETLVRGRVCSRLCACVRKCGLHPDFISLAAITSTRKCFLYELRRV